MGSETTSPRRVLSALALLIALAAWAFVTRPWEKTPGADAPADASRSAAKPPAGTAPRAPSAAGYDPKDATPAEAIPGGGLAAHEGIRGAHTLARHVGKSQ